MQRRVNRTQSWLVSRLCPAPEYLTTLALALALTLCPRSLSAPAAVA
mgnify:CR=1 FL=1